MGPCTEGHSVLVVVAVLGGESSSSVASGIHRVAVSPVSLAVVSPASAIG